jgi:hypothetical protein
LNEIKVFGMLSTIFVECITQRTKEIDENAFLIYNCVYFIRNFSVGTITT